MISYQFSMFIIIVLCVAPITSIVLEGVCTDNPFTLLLKWMLNIIISCIIILAIEGLHYILNHIRVNVI